MIISVLEITVSWTENKCRSDRKIRCSDDLESPKCCALLLLMFLSASRSIFSDKRRALGFLFIGYRSLSLLLRIESLIAEFLLIKEDSSVFNKFYP